MERRRREGRAVPRSLSRSRSLSLSLSLFFSFPSKLVDVWSDETASRSRGFEDAERGRFGTGRLEHRGTVSGTRVEPEWNTRERSARGREGSMSGSGFEFGKDGKSSLLVWDVISVSLCVEEGLF